jgi:uncharacterized protein (DUF2336 family)
VNLQREKSDEPATMKTIDSLIDELQNRELSGSTKRQLKALTRLTELFVAGSGRYSNGQIELFDEVFKTLVAVIELKTRVKLAHRLAADSHAPAALVRAFASDGNAAVAAPMLSQSTVLSEADLAKIATTQSQDHLYAIALRQSVSKLVTDILIERGEINVVHAVARNAGADISDRGFERLILRACSDSQLALHVGSRRDIPRRHLLALLDAVSAEVCGRIIAANPQFADVAQDAVTEVIDEINLEIRQQSPDHAKARKKVRRLKYWKELGEAKVHRAARAQDFEQAVLALSILARCPIEVVERAVLNENPGAIQVVAKAAGCAWITVKALLQMRAERRMSKADLERARHSYERLELRTARLVLDFYDSRRHLPASASPSIVPEAATTLEAPATNERAA